MSEKILFENMYRLTKQLKGGPLKDYEKEALKDKFNRSEGSAFKRAENAIATVLHGNPSFIHEKAEALDDVKQLINNIRKAAANLNENKY